MLVNFPFELKMILQFPVGDTTRTLPSSRDKCFESPEESGKRRKN